MYYLNYPDGNFVSYLNRYLTGCVKFADEIRSIDVSFSLNEAFSNYSIRFSIDVEFKDLGKLAKECSQALNTYFYNSYNGSGSAYVSFVYKGNRSYELDIERIEDFIRHYQLAEGILNGFLKNLLPDPEILRIRPLESEPFMNYAARFLFHKRYDTNRPRFQNQYSEFFKRSFELDCLHHDRLVRNAVSCERQETVSDEALAAAGGGEIDAIRTFVLREKIPYEIAPYSSTVDLIFIDKTALRRRIERYVPESYEHIRPAMIVACLDKIEREEKQEALRQGQRLRQLETLVAEAGLAAGDYICVKGRADSDYRVGKVVEFAWGYGDTPLVKYNVLKKDLTESCRPLRDAALGDVRYVLKPEVFDREFNREGFALTTRFVALCKKSGIKPVLPKEKKKW